MCCCHADIYVLPLGHEICSGLLNPKCLSIHERNFSAVALGTKPQPVLTEISQVTWVY